VYRRICVPLLLSMSLLASCSSAAKQGNWAKFARLDRSKPEAAPTQRPELERLRQAAVEGDDAAVAAYLRYLWQFDWEWRLFMDQPADARADEMPEALSGYDRAAYTQEALAAWQRVRPTELPSEQARRESLLGGDMVALALGGGCAETTPGYAQLLVHWGELRAPDDRWMRGVLRAECNDDKSFHNDACRLALDHFAATTPMSIPPDTDGDGISDPDGRLWVYQQCGEYTSGGYEGIGLWATNEEMQFYDAFRNRQYSQAYGGAPAPSGGSSGSSGSSGATTVSISLYNACPSTVRIFEGKDPQFGGGKQGSLSSNTRTSYSGQSGDMIWLTDESGKGLSAITLSPGASDYEVTQACTSIVPK
jgi:hypothetical protein